MSTTPSTATALPESSLADAIAATRSNAFLLGSASQEVSKINAAAGEIHRLIGLLQPIGDQTSLLAQVYDLKTLRTALSGARDQALQRFEEADRLIASQLEDGMRLAMEGLGLSASNLGVIATAVDAGKPAKPSKPARLYRSPDGLATWTGTGRRPSWIVAAIEKGIDVSTFLVADPVAAEGADTPKPATGEQSVAESVRQPAPAIKPSVPDALRTQAWPPAEATPAPAALGGSTAPVDPTPDDGAFSAESPALDGHDTAFLGPQGDEVSHDLDSLQATGTVSHDLSMPIPQSPGAAAPAPAPVDDEGLDSFMSET
ncbi:MAG: H-NS histone family protein [Polaromonas sp.]|nr:H-NS histone family protein [Polaromonas sp.]